MLAIQQSPEEPVCVRIARQICELVAAGELPASAPRRRVAS